MLLKCDQLAVRWAGSPGTSPQDLLLQGLPGLRSRGHPGLQSYLRVEREMIACDCWQHSIPRAVGIAASVPAGFLQAASPVALAFFRWLCTTQHLASSDRQGKEFEGSGDTGVVVLCSPSHVPTHVPPPLPHPTS